MKNIFRCVYASNNNDKGLIGQYSNGEFFPKKYNVDAMEIGETKTFGLNGDTSKWKLMGREISTHKFLVFSEVVKIYTKGLNRTDENQELQKDCPKWFTDRVIYTWDNTLENIENAEIYLQQQELQNSYNVYEFEAAAKQANF